MDRKRIGIWGGSYGGLMVALGLSRNSLREAVRALSLDCARVADDVLITARMREW